MTGVQTCALPISEILKENLEADEFGAEDLGYAPIFKKVIKQINDGLDV